MNIPETIYPIRYKIERGQYTKKQLDAENGGGCDNLALISVVGSYGNGQDVSTLFVSAKGDGSGEWTDDDWFQAWSMLTKRISESSNLNPYQRALASQTFECIKDLVLIQRDIQERQDSPS